MKIRERRSKAVAGVEIEAHGEYPPEYGSHIATDGAFVTWIPVFRGEELSVNCWFRGLVSEVRFDLIVDGVLRNASKEVNGRPIYGRRNVNFDTGYYPENNNVMLKVAKLVVRNMNTNAYPTDCIENQDSVGKIEIQVSLRRDGDEGTYSLSGISPIGRVQHWKDVIDIPTYTKVRPTQEIKMVVLDDDCQPKTSSVIKRLSRFDDDRVGTGPWAVFRFFYRTQEAIYAEPLTRSFRQKVFEFNASPIVKTSGASREHETAASKDTKTQGPSLLSQAAARGVSNVIPPIEFPRQIKITSDPQCSTSTLPKPTGLALATPNGENDTRSDKTLPIPLGTTVKAATSSEGSGASSEVLDLGVENGDHINDAEQKTKAEAQYGPEISITRNPGINGTRSKNETNILKRSYSSTPDPARKKVREEIEQLSKKIAERSAVLAEKRQKRINAERIAQDAEKKRAEALQTQLEEIERQLLLEEELEREAQDLYEFEESAITGYSHEKTGI